jgi:hypothetical protein
MADSKEVHVSAQPEHEREHRKSSITSIAAGFETQNIFQLRDKTDQGQNPHGNSTTFASAGLDDYYKPQPHWEGLHRYDPDFTWEPLEEKRLVRKISPPPPPLSEYLATRSPPSTSQLDYRVCSFACLMFFSLQLDRGNISQALSDNMLKDLHMTIPTTTTTA